VGRADEGRHEQRGCKQNEMTDNRLTAYVWLERRRHIVAMLRGVAERLRHMNDQLK